MLLLPPLVIRQERQNSRISNTHVNAVKLCIAASARKENVFVLFFFSSLHSCCVRIFIFFFHCYSLWKKYCNSNRDTVVFLTSFESKLATQISWPIQNFLTAFVLIIAFDSAEGAHLNWNNVWLRSANVPAEATRVSTPDLDTLYLIHHKLIESKHSRLHFANFPIVTLCGRLVSVATRLSVPLSCWTKCFRSSKIRNHYRISSQTVRHRVINQKMMDTWAWMGKSKSVCLFRLYGILIVLFSLNPQSFVAKCGSRRMWQWEEEIAQRNSEWCRVGCCATANDTA